MSDKAEAKMQDKCQAGLSQGCIYGASLAWHTDSPLLDKSQLWRGQGMQLSITYCKSQRVLRFLLQTSGCHLCGGSPPPHPFLLLAAACGHSTPALLPASYASPRKHPPTAEGWSQHDLREPSQHRLLEKPTLPIYTPTAAAEAEQTEHLQTQENSTASFQEIIVIHKTYSPFCSPLKKKLKLINLFFAMATTCSSLMTSE